MRKFIRYVLCGREGLRSYLAFLGVVFGGLFAVYMLLLGILTADKVAERVDLALYEVLGSAGAAIGFAILTERMLRIAVNMGVSRRSFLRGTVLLAPLFALATTAVNALFFVITDGIFGLSGNALSCIGNILGSGVSLYDASAYSPHMAEFSLSANFCLILFLYSFALLFVCIKKRFNLPAAAIVTGVALICSFYQVIGSYNFQYNFIDPILYHMVPEDSIYNYLPVEFALFSFGECLLRLIAVTVLWYLIFYVVFTLLTRRTPVCGKEQEGDI